MRDFFLKSGIRCYCVEPGSVVFFSNLKKKKRNFLQSLMDFSQFISRGMEYIFQCGLNVFIISQGVHKMFEKISVERKGRKKTLGI